MFSPHSIHASGLRAAVWRGRRGAGEAPVPPRPERGVLCVFFRGGDYQEEDQQCCLFR